jgi:hypothetical protein
LGSFSIPFSAIYQSIKVEGTFKLRKPLFSLSHEKDVSHKEIGILSEETMISVYATLNPPIQKPPFIQNENVSLLYK